MYYYISLKNVRCQILDLSILSKPNFCNKWLTESIVEIFVTNFLPDDALYLSRVTVFIKNIPNYLKVKFFFFKTIKNIIYIIKSCY